MAKRYKETPFVKFIKDSVAKYGDRFDYQHVVWLGRYEKVYIVCSIHGGFWLSPYNHLYQKHGCYGCGMDAISKNVSKSISSWISKCESVHGKYYDYSLVGEGTKFVTVICPVHGQFSIDKANHAHGKGCGKCRRGVRSKVSDWLDSHGFEYVKGQQFRYWDRRMKKPRVLTFDWYIPSLDVVIEWFDKSHFQHQAFSLEDAFKKDLRYKKIASGDLRKRRFCKDVGMKLKRVFYYHSVDGHLKFLLRLRESSDLQPVELDDGKIAVISD